MFAPRSYALASGLRGFPSSSLRVRIVEVLSDGQHVNVLTADLLSVGVPLTIDVSRLSPIDGEGEAAVEAETSAHDDWLLHHTAEDCGATCFVHAVPAFQRIGLDREGA